MCLVSCSGVSPVDDECGGIEVGAAYRSLAVILGSRTVPELAPVDDGIEDIGVASSGRFCTGSHVPLTVPKIAPTLYICDGIKRRNKRGQTDGAQDYGRTNYLICNVTFQFLHTVEYSYYLGQ